MGTLEKIAKKLATTSAWPEFRDWMAEYCRDMFDRGAQSEAPPRMAAMNFARELWRRTPDPAHGWRPRSSPALPGRNDPCWCGSGKKYKHCCHEFEQRGDHFPLDSTTLAGMLFIEGPAAWRTPDALRKMPPDMLTAAAHYWSEKRGADAMVKLLEPLFTEPAGLDGRHEQLLDMLFDAALEAGKETYRKRLVERMTSNDVHAELRVAAWGRRAAMLSDREQHAEAWQALQAALRILPQAPQLAHLELTLLHSAGRSEEARLRAPLLAAQARRAGYHDLAEILLELGQHGMSGLPDRIAADMGDDPMVAPVLELLHAPIPQLTASNFLRWHDLKTQSDNTGETDDETGTPPQLQVAAKRPLQTMTRDWQRQFAVPSPRLAGLEIDDASELLDNAAAATERLRSKPELAVSIPVLDGLLLAARAAVTEFGTLGLERCLRNLAFAAGDMVIASLASSPAAQLPWAVLENRPLLRVVAQATSIAVSSNDPADVDRAEHYMRWMLQRNPVDNHGWREPLRHLMLGRGDHASALAILNPYPNDFPPCQHDRALALYLSTAVDEAEAVLRAAHAEYPAFVAALLPDEMDRPKLHSAAGYTVGKADHAWFWRNDVRAIWQRSGALEWLRELRLPKVPKAPKAAKRPKAESRPQPVEPDHGGDAPTVEFMKDDLADASAHAVLAARFADQYPWLLGALNGIAWSPAILMPNQWLSTVLGRAPDVAVDEAMLNALMHVYNQLTMACFNGDAASDFSLPAAFADSDDAAWNTFAAGFVQIAEQLSRGGWRNAGLPVSEKKGAFAPLYQLAALAPVAEDGWRATGETGQPLLELAEQPLHLHGLLQRALQPIWSAAVIARQKRR